MKKMIFMILMAFIAMGVNAQNDSIAADSINASQGTTVAQSNSEMTGEQLYDLEMAKINRKLENGMVPIVAIVAPFLAGLLLLIGYFIYAYNSKKRKYELMKIAIEHGRDIPADFFNEKKIETKNRLQTAMIQIGFGIGLMVFFALFEQERYIAFGAIPLFIGIGNLIAYIIEQKKLKNQPISEEAQVVESTKNSENE